MHIVIHDYAYGRSMFINDSMCLEQSVYVFDFIMIAQILAVFAKHISTDHVNSMYEVLSTMK